MFLLQIEAVCFRGSAALVDDILRKVGDCCQAKSFRRVRAVLVREDGLVIP